MPDENYSEPIQPLLQYKSEFLRAKQILPVPEGEVVGAAGDGGGTTNQLWGECNSILPINMFRYHAKIER